AKAGSSSVTIRYSRTATSKCFCSSACRAASQCWLASGDIVCSDNKTVRRAGRIAAGIMGAPAHVLQEIGRPLPVAMIDGCPRARKYLLSRFSLILGRSEDVCRWPTHNSPRLWKNEFVHLLARGLPDRRGCRACLEE